MPWGSAFILAVLVLCLYLATMAALLAVFGSGLALGAVAVVAVMACRVHR